MFVLINIQSDIPQNDYIGLQAYYEQELNLTARQPLLPSRYKSKLTNAVD